MSEKMFGIIIIIIEKERKSQNILQKMRIKQRKICVSAGNRTQDHNCGQHLVSIAQWSERGGAYTVVLGSIPSRDTDFSLFDSHCLAGVL